MMDAEHLDCYRTNYNPDFWRGYAESVGRECSAPFGAVLAVNALCDEVERLQAQIDLLREALGEIEWSNDTVWQAERAMVALKAIDDTEDKP